jgi:multiple sugar transport system substrate-binding protein
MHKLSACLCFGLCAAGALTTAIAHAAQSGPLVFLSTQLRPIEEAQKMRNLILEDFPREVDYVTEQPQQFTLRIKAELDGGKPAIDVVGALHGELQPLVELDALVPLDDLTGRLTGRGVPDRLLTLGKFGTTHQLYAPWMQASYIMVANKAALPYLPDGADLDALGYDQLTAWAGAIHQKTGKQMLGFPAGPQGLMHRFFEGFLYPSYTGGVVAPFRSQAAEAMWIEFASLWKSVSPNSTGYNFMQQPLLSGDVWIGWDHVARVLDALRQKPDQFVALPAPVGPKGRGYMPVLAGLAVLKGASDMSGAMALVDYLTDRKAQVVTAREVGFFPVVQAKLSPPGDPGLEMAAIAIQRMQSAKDALPALPPVGLGEHDADFDKVFMDAFQLIVLRGQKPRTVLDREAETLQRVMTETGASCWQPDPPSAGSCQVQ